MANKNDYVTLEGVRIVFRNFAGAEKKYNDAGDRNFAVVLPPYVADEMEKDGWNVKRRPPKEEGDEEFCFLKVTVSYKSKPPRLMLITKSLNRRTTLDEDTAEMLDYAEYDNVDVALNPYDWEVNGNRGRKAYLRSIWMTIHEDELDLKYAHIPEGKAYADEPSDEDLEEFE
jgi:hypothetical protein